MPKFYWLGTFFSGVLLVTTGHMEGIYRWLPYILMTIGIVGLITQSWFDQKRRPD